MQVEEFYSHGKLLLTGEYVVLDGAKAVALPCKLGQSLKVETQSTQNFEWKSYLKNGELWQKTVFNLNDVKNLNYKNAFDKRLIEIFNIIFQLKPKLFESAYSFTTKLDFEKEWGLGSSSTLINNLASWAKIDAYELLERSFGGSGYDIAAAKLKSPFIYQRKDNQIFTTPSEIDDSLKPHLFFVYLNQKQNSREAIRAYREISTKQQKDSINLISKLTLSITKSSDLGTFESLLQEHENILSKILKQTPVQHLRFKDYNYGIVKSLGAWGGDFVLVTAGKIEHLNYFKQKGYKVIFNYNDLVF